MKNKKSSQTNKKRTLKDVFDSFPSRVWLDWHDKEWEKDPEKAQSKFKEEWGDEFKPRLYFPISIQWSEKGRGFGEYTFWQEDGKIYCDNESDSRESVKKVLCQMVDQAILVDKEPKMKCPKNKQCVKKAPWDIADDGRPWCKKCDKLGKDKK